MNETLTVVFGLLGGLAMFLFGMNTMSDSLQKAAGERMRYILGLLTRNRFMGALAGALVTAVLQSSSATTVMVIGFVSAGLMTLPQGISVLFGANIGTTMTAQLMAFKISDYIYPIIFVGFLIHFIFKNEKIKSIGMVILSFGLLFEGIEIMGSVMAPLASNDVFLNLMGKVADNRFLGVALGTCMTVLVQSSSATIAVLQNFASQAGPDGVTSILGLTGAIPILLGDNIGTTITALLASIGQNRNAKRTAIAHTTFNVSGTMVFIWLIDPVAKLIQAISGNGPEVEIISRQIANTHTFFNVICTLVWLPLLGLMVKIVCAIIPEPKKKAGQDGRLEYLEENLLVQPSAALAMATEGVRQLSNETKDMLLALTHGLENTDIIVAFEEYNKAAKKMRGSYEQIDNYLTKLLSSNVILQEQVDNAAKLLYVAKSMDRIYDRCEEAKTNMTAMEMDGRNISDFARGDLKYAMSLVQNLFIETVEALENGNSDLADTVESDKNKLRKFHKRSNKDHFRRVKAHECDAALTPYYTDLLFAVERMGDTCVSVAEEVYEGFSLQKLALNDVS